MATKTKKYAGGGVMPTKGRPAATGLARAAAMSGRTMPTTGRASAYSKGGSVGSASRRADGVAKKGKTKGIMVKMSKGGAC